MATAALILDILLACGCRRGVGEARDDQPPAARAVRQEYLRPNNGPDGRPLPLAGHWNRGDKPDGFSPEWQIEMIRRGYPLLPWFTFPPTGADALRRLPYYETSLRLCAEWGLPITLVGTQWDASLYREARFKDLPPDVNPCWVDLSGEVRTKLCPLGPVKTWEEVGGFWTDTPLMRKLQEIYPAPPGVILLSNNEAARLRWHEAEESKRFVERHGRGKEDDFKRRVFGDGWIERYRAMQRGMREGLARDEWRRNARFVGYGAFGPSHMGRWAGWPHYSLHCRGRIAPDPLMWDGGSPSYYTHDCNPSTDHTVWSPQLESMNWVFMLEEAHRLNPNFWFELSVWDGDTPGKKGKIDAYLGAGQDFTPERYRGFCQFGMWLLTPRLVREFRGYLDTRDRVGARYEALMDAVRLVHEDPVLRRFWRESRLVPNDSGQHPYQTDVPLEWAAAKRWFLLDTDLDPPRPWKLDTKIPVFALARSAGPPGRREWLVYAHSPLGNRSGVEISIPVFGPVRTDVPAGGTFVLAKEADGSTVPVGSP